MTTRKSGSLSPRRVRRKRQTRGVSMRDNLDDARRSSRQSDVKCPQGGRQARGKVRSKAYLSVDRGGRSDGRRSRRSLGHKLRLRVPSHPGTCRGPAGEPIRTSRPARTRNRWRRPCAEWEPLRRRGGGGGAGSGGSPDRAPRFLVKRRGCGGTVGGGEPPLVHARKMSLTWQPTFARATARLAGWFVGGTFVEERYVRGRAHIASMGDGIRHCTSLLSAEEVAPRLTDRLSRKEAWSRVC